LSFPINAMLRRQTYSLPLFKHSIEQIIWIKLVISQFSKREEAKLTLFKIEYSKGGLLQEGHPFFYLFKPLL